MTAATRVRLVIGALTLVLSAAPRVAAAQAGQPVASPGHPIELAVGGFAFGETSYGTTTAEFIANNGSRLTVFQADTVLRPGFGLDLHFGIGLTPAFAIEGSGSWTRADFRTRVTDDVEGVGETVIKEPLTRFAVEGAALWMFARGGKTNWFIRGSAGWMRDLTGNDSLVEDGIAGSVGGGLKYLWNPGARGGFRATGFRIEGRALLHKRGLVPGPDRERLRVTPAVAGSLIFGF